MMKKSPLLILMCLLLVLSCGRAETPAPREPVQSTPSPSSDLAPAAPGQYSLSLNPAPEGPRGKPNAEGEVRRHIAVGHNVLLEMPEGEFVKGWQAVNEFCQSIRCEIIDSSIRQKTPNSPPSGSMRLRVAPENVKPLFAHLGKVGKVLQHQTRSEDLTTTVIDVEAKIKNLTELRDRLRNMLASRPGVLKDVIEVERELFRVQSNLDSLQMNRKALAHRTEKVAVDITFQARKSITESGTFAPVVSAWNESIYVLVQSFALVITFIVAILPWLAVFGPILWVTVRLIKRIQAQRRKNLQDLIHPEEPQ